MYTGRTVFSQLIDFLPRHEFSKCVRRYQGNYRDRRGGPARDTSPISGDVKAAQTSAFIGKNIAGLGRKSRRARSARIPSDQLPVCSEERRRYEELIHSLRRGLLVEAGVRA